jgi:predicted nucleotidyltransferase
LKRSIEIMSNEIISILKENIVAIYLIGSVTLNDFKLGWSDIDILCLTDRELTEEQAQQLVFLRRRLLEREIENLYFRSFEGAISSLDEFLNTQYTKVVYWGTSGQRITDNYYFDAFSKYELIRWYSALRLRYQIKFEITVLCPTQGRSD